ncbi:cytochrome P450 [Thalassococcus sp. CAU 1522]|uniref:Cytochrome P450 n=1 Tax=Thalassococcus arenae TaxID=2851652 RepID=A0ABS6NAV2_9RHOB|nr:cytochrome P450 [Thalassococcus arenae]MBV2360660.1 cytochrome P450 [Thalassococcus arenae]
MQRIAQDPGDPGFVQNPYPHYHAMRRLGDMIWWDEFAMPCAVSHRAVQALLRDRRFGREIPAEMAPAIPARLRPFYKVEAHSLLEAEPPRHTRLRGLVLRAFTSRRIAALGPEIAALAHALLRDAHTGPFDLLEHFCTPIPVRIIARLLGVPEAMAPQLLAWSHAMVAMYQAGRTRAVEDAAAAAADEFSAFLADYIETRRADPRDDLITHLIAAETDGDRLNRDELIATCILILNAGHEATVHSLANGVKSLLQAGTTITPDTAEPICEEILRFDPPLHMFTRHAYEEAELFGHTFRRGDQVALLLAAANRDPAIWPDPDRFDPGRAPVTHHTFGGGLHFCVGAPLARLEMRVALPILFDALPGLRIVAPPVYADSYHFHGLTRLMVSA